MDDDRTTMIVAVDVLDLEMMTVRLLEDDESVAGL